MTNRTYILSTRPLSQSLVIEAEQEGIVIDTHSFIKTEQVKNNDLQQLIESLFTQELTAVFTSMNAVEAVASFLSDHQPPWKIFCIGDTTASLLRQYFGASCIAATADSAAELADVIIEAGVQEVAFFCGDQRRPELPDKMAAKKIAVKEVMVYRTIATPVKVERSYDGILFFSPSAVESFFAVNKTSEGVILFAIGNTTADTIRKFSGNEIITGNKPGKEMLARQAMTYFRSARLAE